jgi:hypothetical protein
MTPFNRWLAEDGRRCVRCGAEVHPPDPPHLCKDLQERLEKQTKAIRAIADPFHDALCSVSHHDSREIYAAAQLGETQPCRIKYDRIAEQVYRTLSGRDLP